MLNDDDPRSHTVTLLTTALGSGCSILLAMSDAIVALGPRFISKKLWSRILRIFLASVVMRGQSIVDMMADLNMVYLTAIGPLLGLGLLRVRIPNKAANMSVANGCSIAVTCYFLRSKGFLVMPKTTPLLVSPLLHLTAMLARHTSRAYESRKPNRPPGLG